MNTVFWDGLLQAVTANVPVLPTLWLTQLWQSLAWSVVLAWLAVMLVRRLSSRRAVHAGGALVIVAWTWWPGPGSPAYWLALAFQTPSVLTVLWCGLLLWQTLGRRAAGTAQDATRTAGRSLLMWSGVLLGWALLLDTFALLPVQLYAWGMSPWAVAWAVALALLPWLTSLQASRMRAADWMPLIAVLLFVATRLPTGNVWDAVLDPWLWLVLQGILLRAVLKRY